MDSDSANRTETVSISESLQSELNPVLKGDSLCVGEGAMGMDISMVFSILEPYFFTSPS